MSFDYKPAAGRLPSLSPVVPVLESPQFCTHPLGPDSPVSTALEDFNLENFNTRPAVWNRRHLLDLESLSAAEINCILDAAEAFKRQTAGCRRKIQVLPGRTLANLFFENSTRTRNSFSLAARRLGADTVEFSSSGTVLENERDDDEDD